MGYICLCHGAEHLLRRFGCGKIFYHFRILGLDEPYPSGTAGSKHRPAVVLSVLQPLKELAAFFHYGHICRIVGIEHIIYANLFKGADQFPDGAFLFSQAYLFAPGGPYRRSYLSDYYLVRISYGIIKPVSVISLP